MAKFRQIHVEFWQDGFVLELTPEEKYFYLYLMTNSKTAQCGIYELPLRVIEMETGYNREKVWELLRRFQDYEKILYDPSTKEVMILNWIKYNGSKSPKVTAFIKKELTNVKTPSFIEIFYEKWEQYGYDIDTVSIDLGEEKEQQQEGEEENIQEIYNHYLSKNIIYHKKLTDSMRKEIRARLKEYSVEELKQAIDNYATVLHGDEYWFHYKYPLADFMREKDIQRFLDEAEPLHNFRSDWDMREEDLFERLLLE